MPTAGEICECVTVKSITISKTSSEIIDWLLLVLVSVTLLGGLTVPFAAIPPKLVGADTITSNSTLELLGMLDIEAVITLAAKFIVEKLEAPPTLF